MTCPFCRPVEQEERIITSNTQCYFMQTDETILMGSGIICPKRHRETVFDLSVEEWRSTYDLLNEVKVYIDGLYAPDGYNVGWNSGHIAGQEVFHAHLWVIPRFIDEPYAGKGIRYWLKQNENRRQPST